MGTSTDPFNEALNRVEDLYQALNAALEAVTRLSLPSSAPPETDADAAHPIPWDELRLRYEAMAWALADAQAANEVLAGDNARLVDALGAAQRQPQSPPAGQVPAPSPKPEPPPSRQPLAEIPHPDWPAGQATPAAAAGRRLLSHGGRAPVIGGSAPVRVIDGDPATYKPKALEARVGDGRGRGVVLAAHEPVTRIRHQFRFSAGEIPDYLRLAAVIGRPSPATAMPFDINARVLADDQATVRSWGAQVIVWAADGAYNGRLGLRLAHRPGGGDEIRATQPHGTAWTARLSPTETEIHSRAWQTPDGRWHLDPDHQIKPGTWRTVTVDAVSAFGPYSWVTLALDGKQILQAAGIDWSPYAQGGWTHSGLTASADTANGYLSRFPVFYTGATEVLP